MSQASGVPLEELRQYMFLYHDREATEHIMRVSGGLDSLVMGEGQILAQVPTPPRTYIREPFWASACAIKQLVCHRQPLGVFFNSTAASSSLAMSCQLQPSLRKFPRTFRKFFLATAVFTIFCSAQSAIAASLCVFCARVCNR